MKNKNFMVATMLMLSATAANAQQHVQKAFEALLKEKYVEIKTQHSLEKDPETGNKEGEMDVYDFELPSPTSKQQQLVKDVERAFEKDKEEAYSLNSSNYGNNVSLAVGDGRTTGVGLGRIKGSRYIYACFLDKDDPEKNHRYAYAMEWVENDKKITVRLAKTYAITMKYRTSRKSSRSIIVNGQEIDIPGMLGETLSLTASGSDGLHSASWLSQFNTARTLFQKNPDGTSANVWATKIYKLCKDASSLDEEEKSVVMKEIRKLRAKTEDEFIQNLFDMSIERLKK